MVDQGAVLVVVVLAAFQPAVTADGFARRALSAPVATVRQYVSLAACEDAAQRWRDDLEEFPLPGRTVRVFCVTP